MILIKHALKFACPCCRRTVPWLERSRFLRLLGKRRPGQCPHCLAWIIWDQWSHRLLAGGLLGMLGLILLDSAGLSSSLGRQPVLGLYIAALGLVVLGYIKLRFVRYDPSTPCPAAEAEGDSQTSTVSERGGGA